MLPPGHAAAGYLIAHTLLKLTKPPFTQTQVHELEWWGAFSGFVPDLDFFYAFWQAKAFTIRNKNINHRYFITHTPFFWLIVSAPLILFRSDPFWQYAGLILLLGSWSHFLLDSFRVGVRWLYPFSKHFYALEDAGMRDHNEARGFKNHWWHLVRMYAKKSKKTFYLEIIIVLAAIWIMAVT